MLKASLLWSTKDYWHYLSAKLICLINLFMKDGTGVNIVFSCVGYGVMSFWGAFVIANQGQWKKACIVSWGKISH